MGDAVLFVTLMQQLYGPLNFFGTCEWLGGWVLGLGGGILGRLVAGQQRARMPSTASRSAAAASSALNQLCRACLSLLCLPTDYRMIQQAMLDMENM